MQNLVTDSKTRHDFINNGLRIEVLNKLIIDSLEGNKGVPQELITDLTSFLEQQIMLSKKFEPSH